MSRTALHFFLLKSHYWTRRVSSEVMEMAMTESRRETVLSPLEIEHLPWVMFDAHGSKNKTLWRDASGISYAGLLRIEADGQVPVHHHRYAIHHIFVVEGSCEIEGRKLQKGSYAFVPVDLEHGIDHVGDEGCTLFYLYTTVAEID